jgi:hypothetical protein
MIAGDGHGDSLCKANGVIEHIGPTTANCPAWKPTRGDGIVITMTTQV